MELLGWIGSLAFAICGLPQAILSYKQGHSAGISWGFISLWAIGEVLTLIYVFDKGHPPLIFNYVGNLIFVGIILRYKIWPRA